jgi:Na+/proline symporter
MTVLTAIYVVAGGYMATVVNDFVQGIIMLVGIVVIVWASLRQFGGLQAGHAQSGPGHRRDGVRGPRHLHLVLRPGPAITCSAS